LKESLEGATSSSSLEDWDQAKHRKLSVTSPMMVDLEDSIEEAKDDADEAEGLTMSVRPESLP
jgi:hypothetical protein